MPRTFSHGVLLAAVVLAASDGLAGESRPRIFVKSDDLPRLRAPAKGGRADGWKKIIARAEGFLRAGAYHYAVHMPGREGGPSRKWQYTLSHTPPPRHDEYRHYPPWTAMFQERGDSITTRIKYLASAWLIARDERYFRRALKIVLALCAWGGIWTDPSYGGGRACLDTGHAAAWVGIFYDWCHARLTPEQRKTIRTALAAKALVPIDKTIDRVAPYHNYTAVVATGLCIGGIALLGEDARADGWIRHALARAKLHFDAQGKDGGAMEGPMYGTYAANSFADMLWALTTAGVEHRLFEHNYLRTLPRYCISLLNPSSATQPCFGDGGPTAGFGRLMLMLALRGDRGAAWYCRQIGYLAADSPRGVLALAAGRIRPQRPTRNPSDCFVDVGYAILRDGYRPGGAFLAFKCGPPRRRIGHNHFDHNSFQINYAGEWIVRDPGYRSYFDPARRKYTVSTLGHNSLIVDFSKAYLANKAVTVAGHDQVRLAGGQIAEYFTSDAFDYVLGRAAAVYNTKAKRTLDRFDRRIVFAKPDVFFIHDTIAAPAEHTYTFLLHAGRGGYRIRGDRVDALDAQSRIQAHVNSPAGIGFTSASYRGAESYGPYLAATTAKCKATTITAVLVPRPSGEMIANPGFERGKVGWQPRNMPGFGENHVIDHEVKHAGRSSARIDNGGYYYSSRFRLPPGTKLTARWWAKCTAARGASSILYYWRGASSFARKLGPAANVDAWKQYELSAVVPEGTQSICLALQFFGQGRCWYDDVEIVTDAPRPRSQPAEVTWLDSGAAGAVCRIGERTYALIAGRSGQTHTAAGRRIVTDAPFAVVRLAPGSPAAFLPGGGRITVDGKPISPAAGTWRVRAN